MKTTLKQLQEMLQFKKKFLLKLESMQHIDAIELKDYGLRDARKIADALGLIERKSWNEKQVTAFEMPGEYEFGKENIWMTRGKPYDWSECSVINISIRVYSEKTKYNGEIAIDSEIEKFELGDSYAKYKKRTIADCIANMQASIAEYEKAIATYAEYEAKETEWNEYNRNASYLLRN